MAILIIKEDLVYLVLYENKNSAETITSAELSGWPILSQVTHYSPPPLTNQMSDFDIDFFFRFFLNAWLMPWVIGLQKKHE